MESGGAGKALFVRAFFDGAGSSEYKHTAADDDADEAGRPRRVTIFADPLTVRKQQGIQAIERAMERQRSKEASKNAWAAAAAEAAAEAAAAAAEAAARNGRLCNLCRDDGQDSLEATAHPGGRMGAIYGEERRGGERSVWCCVVLCGAVWCDILTLSLSLPLSLSFRSYWGWYRPALQRRPLVHCASLGGEVGFDGDRAGDSCHGLVYHHR